MLTSARSILPIKNAVPVNIFFQKNQFGLRKTTHRQIGPLLVLSPSPNSSPRFERSKIFLKKHLLNDFMCDPQ